MKGRFELRLVVSNETSRASISTVDSAGVVCRCAISDCPLVRTHRGSANCDVDHFWRGSNPGYTWGPRWCMNQVFMTSPVPRWCMENWRRAPTPLVPDLFGADGDRHAEARHPIENVASDSRLGPLIGQSAGVESSSNDGLVAEHRSLDQASSIVT